MSAVGLRLCTPDFSMSVMTDNIIDSLSETAFIATISCFHKHFAPYYRYHTYPWPCYLEFITVLVSHSVSISLSFLRILNNE